MVKRAVLLTRGNKITTTELTQAMGQIRTMSRAEPIDVFPLLRPFAIGLAIMFFPPIVVMSLLMLSFNLVADGLREALDPKMKSM